MGPKNSCSYADIVAEEIDKQVLESRTIYPELKCWFRFRDDTLVLWRGTIERLQAFFRDLNAFDAYPQFTMEIGGSSLHFLDLSINIRDNKLETSVYSKHTDPHLYLNVKSSHPKAQIVGIARGVVLRLYVAHVKTIMIFGIRAKNTVNIYLIDCGHDKEQFLECLMKLGTLVVWKHVKVNVKLRVDLGLLLVSSISVRQILVRFCVNTVVLLIVMSVLSKFCRRVPFGCHTNGLVI